MSRPTKCRMICRFPPALEFDPATGDKGNEPVILTLDEYEALRLIDREGLSQEQCSQRMQVARTTAQKIYDSARKKLADVLVEGRPLKIQGGEYRLCPGGSQFCGAGCFKRQIHQTFQKPKGDTVMRIAVTYENGQVFQHFGHTEQFKIYDVEDGKVVSSEVVSTNGQGHGALAEVLKNALQADALICGGIGGGAQTALASAGIRLYGGVTGQADAAVEALLAGNLAYDPNVQCSHHEGHHQGGCGGHHHGEDHECRHGHCI